MIEIENSSEELEESISQLNSSLEKMQTDQQNDHLQVERKQRVMDKFLARKSVLMQKKETALGHIRDLGVLPEGAFDKYQDVEAKNLLSSLHKVNEVLKKYSHVNKKAFEQYGNFTKQREQLQNRKGELDSSAKVFIYSTISLTFFSLLKNLLQHWICARMKQSIEPLSMWLQTLLKSGPSLFQKEKENY